MWKVTLKDGGYNTIEFNFEDYNEATEFIYEALGANKNIQAIVTLVPKNMLVEAGEE